VVVTAIWCVSVYEGKKHLCSHELQGLLAPSWSVDVFYWWRHWSVGWAPPQCFHTVDHPVKLPRFMRIVYENIARVLCGLAALLSVPEMCIRCFITEPSFANRRPANRRFDPSTHLHYVNIPKRSSFPGQSTIADARALSMFTSSFTSARHSGTVEVQYQCSLFSITF
jgi:hypothetical protein